MSLTNQTTQSEGAARLPLPPQKAGALMVHPQQSFAWTKLSAVGRRLAWWLPTMTTLALPSEESLPRAWQLKRRITVVSKPFRRRLTLTVTGLATVRGVTGTNDTWAPSAEETEKKRLEEQLGELRAELEASQQSHAAEKSPGRGQVRGGGPGRDDNVRGRRR